MLLTCARNSRGELSARAMKRNGNEAWTIYPIDNYRRRLACYRTFYSNI